MSNPHLNINGDEGEKWRRGVIICKNPNYSTCTEFHWTPAMIAEETKAVDKDKDPDGPIPNQKLSQAILSYAYKKALSSQ